MSATKRTVFLPLFCFAGAALAGCRDDGNGGTGTSLPVEVAGADAVAGPGDGDDVFVVRFTGSVEPSSATDAASYEIECPIGDSLDLAESVSSFDAATGEATFTLVGDVHLPVGSDFRVRAFGVRSRGGCAIDPALAEAGGVVGGRGAGPFLSTAVPAEGGTQGGYTIVLRGGGFTSSGDTAVTIGGSAAADVTVTSGSSLTARVPRGLAGGADVTVSNSNGTVSSTGLFRYVPRFPSYRASLVHYTGNIPYGVATGDFDRDGVLDLAVTSLDDDEVTILRGRGNGDFDPGRFAPSNAGPSRIRIADFNGDGIPDMATTGTFDDSVAIFLGRGDLTFDGPALHSVGDWPEGLDVGDLDGDGNLDVAAGSRDDKNVTLLFGDGAGGFPAAWTSPLVARTPIDVVIADVDGDGDLDVATANDHRLGTVSFLVSGGGRAFVLADNALSAGSGCSAIDAADADGDGLVDLAVANSDSDDVSFFRGAGGGAFDPEVRLAAGREPTDAGFADADGDGILDLFSTVRREDRIVLWYGSPDSGFSPPVRHDVDHEPKGAVFGDLTGDGVPDLVTVNTFANTVSVLLGEESGRFMDKAAFPADQSALAGPSGAALADVDRDGIEDLVLLARSSANVGVFRGNGTGGFVEPGTLLPAGGDPSDVACADLDGDGDLDIVVADPAGARFLAWLGDGAGGSSGPVESTVGFAPFSFRLGDLDSDGLPDVLATLQASNDLGLAFATGTGSFDQDRTLASADGVPLDIALSDLDGDGALDAVVGERSFLTGRFSFYFGTGQGDLILVRTLAVEPPPFRFALVDVTRDGRPDLVTVGRIGFDNYVTTYVASGLLNFQPGRAYVTGEYPFGVVAIDTNRDGNLDFAVANREAGNLTLFNGDSTGVLGFVCHQLTGKAPVEILVGDFDQNGAPDLLTVDEGGGVTIFLNRS